MERFARLVLRHKLLVLLAWLAVLVPSVAASSSIADRLAFDFSLPGQEGNSADRDILATYGNGGYNQPLIPVVTVPPGEQVTDRRDDVARVLRTAVTSAEQAAAQAGPPGAPPPRLRLVDYAGTGDRAFLTADGRSTYALVFTPAPTGFTPGIETQLEPALRAAGAAAGLEVGLTGYPLLAAGGDTEGPSVLLDTLIGGAGALVVLLFVFASLLAFVPLLVAAVAIPSTFLVVYALTTVTEVSFVVQFLASLIGLGVSIDYSLLVVTRWREERAHGRGNDDAVVEAVRTAGHAVVSSGVTVAVSLLALVALPVPFLRSVGLGGLIIPLMATLVSLTLLPALLATRVGQRLEWPRIRKEESASRPWTAWSRLVVRHRWPAALVGLAVVIALTVPFFSIRIGQARSEALTTGGAAYDALQLLSRGGIGTGILTPLELLVAPGGDPAAVAAAARSVEGITTAVAPDDPAWRQGGTALVSVIPAEETVDQTSLGLVDAVKAAADGAADVQATGAGQLVGDYIDAVYRSFPLVLLVIVVLTYLLLARTFRSLLLPLKAVVLNLLSVAATFGAVVLFWQEGYGSEAVFGIAPTGAVTFWLPIMIFAFLFGLSMDYEVFILARTREEYDRTGSTGAAMVEGLGRTGRLVTSAALILFLSFLALTSVPVVDIKVFATALGIGILLDATVVRALLVPALVSLFGRWNWWLPVWAARLLRVEPSPAPPEPSHADQIAALRAVPVQGRPARPGEDELSGAGSRRID